jgi:hypothetical protein
MLPGQGMSVLKHAVLDVSVLKLPVLFLDVSVQVLQQTGCLWTCLVIAACVVLFLYMSGVQQPVCPGHVCSTAASAPLDDVSVLYIDFKLLTIVTSACAAPGLVCCTADSAAWMCLFSVPQLPLELSVLQQYVHCAAPGLVCSKAAFSAPGRICSATTCAACLGASVQQQPVLSPEVTGLRKLVLHLDLSIHKSLCCSCTCSSASFELHLDFSVYKSLCCTFAVVVQICTRRP